jgi:hypothetical protein
MEECKTNLLLNYISFIGLAPKQCLKGEEIIWQTLREFRFLFLCFCIF